MRIIAGIVLACTIFAACSSQKKNTELTLTQLTDSLQVTLRILEGDLEPQEIVKYSEKQVDYALEMLKYYGSSDSLKRWSFEGGKAGRTCGRYQDAITLFKAYIENYPDGEEVPEALFLVGFIYDEDLNDKTRARGCYEKVVGEYPQHELADDAKALLEQLYLTDEQIIEMLKQKGVEA